MFQRKLSVKKERLVELTADDLRGVAGGAPAVPPTLKLRECVQTVSGCTTAMTCPRPQD